MELDTPVFGYIASGSDADWFKLDLSSVANDIEVVLHSTGYTDTKATLLGSDGSTVVATDDDSGAGFNFMMRTVLSAGSTHYLKVEGFDSSELGPYAVFAETVFSLPIDPAESELNKGRGAE